MDSEQRIKALEEELKVVKNEIKAVLLDIREHYLNSNNPFTLSGLPDNDEPPPDEGKEVQSVEPDPEDEPPPRVEKPGADERVRPSGTPGEPVEEPPPPPRHRMSLVTIAGLNQWVDQTTAKMGKERVEALVEVCYTMGRLSPSLRETLIRLVQLSQVKSCPLPVTAKDYLAVLVQLENLLGRSTQSETALLSFLEEGGQL